MSYNDWLNKNNIPNYPSDSDYTTNAPSYYENLARKQKLIKLLAKKIWEYEELLELTLEELETRLQFYIESWDKGLEEFPDNVESLLQDWLSDGTLDHIINDTIFNWKVDQTEFDEFVVNTTSQLAQTKMEMITGKELGLIPKDETQGKSNHVKLNEAVRTGYKILIDDEYFIETVPTEIISDRFISLKGSQPHSKLNIINNDVNIIPVFEIGYNVSIEVESIEFKVNNGNSNELIFKCLNDSSINFFNTSNCKFEGDIQYILFQGKHNVYEDDDFYGIKKIDFNSNSLKNISSTLFFRLTQVPFDRFNIKENDVLNFKGTLITNSIDNVVNDSILAMKRMKILDVENNHVYCEDNWYSDTEPRSTFIYNAFIVYEGDTVYYTKNHIEGIKAKNRRALYDSYLSAKHVYYVNNTIKNNLCFYSDKIETESSLLKSKGRGGGGIRDYDGNTYIIEKEFVDRINENIDNAWVSLFSLEDAVDDFILQNNTFEVYDLRIPLNALRVGNLSFINNSFKGTKIDGVFAFVYTDLYDFDKKIIIDNNKIDFKETDDYFDLFRTIGGSNSNVHVQISNNNVSGVMRHLMFSVQSVDFLDVFDNKIDNRFMFEGTNSIINETPNILKQFNYRGNLFTSVGTVQLPKIRRENVQSSEEYETTSEGGLASLMLYLQQTAGNVDRTYLVNTQIFSIHGLDEFELTFNFKYDSLEDKNYIEYVDGEITERVDLPNSYTKVIPRKILRETGKISSVTFQTNGTFSVNSSEIGKNNVKVKIISI